jgi:HEAT repeat protein
MNRTLIVATGFAVLAVAVIQAQETQPAKGDPKKIVAALVKKLDKANAERLQAIMDLADFGAEAAPAIPGLVEALVLQGEVKGLGPDHVADLRLNAAIALSKIGKEAVSSLAELLTSQDDDIRFHVIAALGWIGPEAKGTAPAVIKALADKNDSVRRKAAYTLGRIAPDAGRAIAVLIEAFKDENEDVRQAASDAVSKFGNQAVKPLITVLDGESSAGRRQAAHALGEIGSDAKAAVPALKKLLLGKDNAAAQQAAEALGKIGKASIDPLVEALKDDRDHVRTLAMSGLAKVGAEAVPYIVDALGDKRVDVRRQAAQALGPMRVSDKMVVLGLAYALKDDTDEQVRNNAMNALQWLGAGAKLAAPILNNVLADANPNLRQQAFWILQSMGEDPRPGLRKALASKDDRIRINTAGLMVTMNVETGTALPVLLDALKHDDATLRVQAAHALAQRQQETSKAIPILIEGLKHEKTSVRQQAVQGLQSFGRNAAVAGPALVDALNDSDANVRQQAVWALQNVRGDSEQMVPLLAKLLKSDKAATRQMALQVLPAHGAKAVPHIIDSIKNDKDPGVQRQAIYTLTNLQGDLAEAIPVLVPLLTHDEAGIRQAAIGAMGRMGAKGVPHLIAGMKDKNEGVRMTAVQWIQNIGPAAKSASPTLRELLKSDPNQNVRNYAMWALVRSDPEAAIPVIMDDLKDKSANKRQIAIQALNNLGPAARKAMPQVVEALKDSDPSVRQQAVWALGNMGPDGHKHIVTGLKTKDSNLRLQMVQVLSNYGFRSKEGVSPLIDCLKDTNPQVRWMAAHVLGQIGPDARSAVPALTELLNDSNQQVRQFAQNALTSIKR